MLEVQHRSWVDYKRGTLLPDLSPKLVLEASETHTALQAMKGYDRDLRSHRPHYLIDPEGYVVYKLSDTAYSVVGDFHPTAPHRNVRCIFAAIVKETALELSEENTIRAGRLIRGICDLESISTDVFRCEPDSDKLGFETLKNLEGVVCWHLFPGNEHVLTPGKINWDQLCEGISLGLDLPPEPEEESTEEKPEDENIEPELESEPPDVDVPAPEAVADATDFRRNQTGPNMDSEPPEQEPDKPTRPEPEPEPEPDPTVVEQLAQTILTQAGLSLPEPEPEPEPDLDALRVVDLKAIAKNLGVTTTDKNKAELVAAIKEARP